MLISRFLDYMEKIEKSSQKTIIAYRTDLLNYEEFMMGATGTLNDNELYAKIQTFHVDSLTAYMRESFAPTTINRKIASIRKFHKYLRTREGIEDKVTEYLVRSKTEKVDEYGEVCEQIEYFTFEEAQHLLSESLNSTRKAKIRNHAMLLTFLLLGLREEELMGLKESDINFEQNTLRVRRKRNKVQTLDMDDGMVLASAIKQALEWKNNLSTLTDKEYVFVSERTGSRLTNKSVDRIVKQCCSDAGLRELSSHKLRHTTATMMFERGADLKEIADLLGHSSTRTTEIYAHTTRRKAKLIVNSNPLLGSY